MKNIAFSFFLSIAVTQLGFAQQELIHANPSILGFDEEFINQKVDSLMKMGIDSLAFPGAQLLVAKNDTVIFHKAYGFHTYQNIQGSLILTNLSVPIGNLGDVERTKKI